MHAPALSSKERADDSSSEDSADPLLGSDAPGRSPRLARLDPLSRLAMLGLATVGALALLGCCAALWARPAARCEPPLADAALASSDEPSHHTIYLVIGADGSAINDHHFLLSESTDMIALCWRQRCEASYAGDVHHPGLEFVYCAWQQ